MFDSKPGPLGWVLPEMEKGIYQIGALGTRHATSFIVTVCPTSRVNYDNVSLHLTCLELFCIEKVERLSRP